MVIKVTVINQRLTLDLLNDLDLDDQNIEVFKQTLKKEQKKISWLRIH